MILWAACMAALVSCTGGYSFTGASIPPEAKTISIHTFPNNARLIQPELSQLLTDAVRNRFMRQTPLSLVEENGDLDIRGEIVDYNTQPQAIQANDQAAKNRLTITIKVKFTNRINPAANFEQQFSRFRDYDSQQNLSDVEGALITVINEELVEDIFNKSVVNW